MLTEIFPESVHMSQLFSTVLCNLVYGELIQDTRDMSNKDPHSDKLLEDGKTTTRMAAGGQKIESRLD